MIGTFLSLSETFRTPPGCSETSPNIPSELLHSYHSTDARSKCRYAFKCVTLWVRIYVDMFGSHSATMINIGILIYVLISTYNTKIFIVWTTYCFRYLSYCLSIHYIARDETSMLISLPGMYSFTRITNVPDRHFDHLSGQTMMNIIIPEWAQKVSLRCGRANPFPAVPVPQLASESPQQLLL